MLDLKVGSKLVLLKWGIFEIIEINSENKTYSIKYLPNDNDFKTPPKLTWLAFDQKNLVEIVALEYDQLLSKDKPDENEDFKNIVNFNSEFKDKFWGEAVLQDLQIDSRIQFERKGFY